MEDILGESAPVKRWHGRQSWGNGHAGGAPTIVTTQENFQKSSWFCTSIQTGILSTQSDMKMNVNWSTQTESIENMTTASFLDTQCVLFKD